MPIHRDRLTCILVDALRLAKDQARRVALLESPTVNRAIATVSALVRGAGVQSQTGGLSKAVRLVGNFDSRVRAA